MSKRTNYINWDEYFMGIALLSAERSKDPYKQVGACIVNEDNKILSIGYNGFPRGCSDDVIPWDKEGDYINTKHAYVCHAELNAILNYTGTTIKNSKIYVLEFPCNECTKAIIQSGIKEIIYMQDKSSDRDNVYVSKKMLDLAGVKYTEYQSRGMKVELEL